jgi:hypothetical protein
MNDTRKFLDPTAGEVTLSQIYKWIRRTAKNVDVLYFDPVFDMLSTGQSCEIHWVTKDGLRCMKSVQRVA